MARRIRKAVFPVAGLGTRFLPATKAIPKEMMPVVDRPVIQHVVDEAREAGIEHFVFITGRNKQVIEDHFDKAFELDTTLASRAKTELMQELQRDLPPAGATSFTRQQEPLGLGHAVWCARDIVGNEPFALLLPDMLHLAKRGGKGCIAAMIEAYQATGGNFVAGYEVPDSETHQYGILGKGRPAAGGAYEIAEMVEKPPRGTAPSNVAISGRYILQPEIFEILATQERGAGGEIQLTDAMLKLKQAQPFYGFTFDGEIHDTGTKLGFLTANVAYALRREDLAGPLRKELGRLSAS
jgi:UTP--glucose-1-phosphate uridylyltransferase